MGRIKMHKSAQNQSLVELAFSQLRDDIVFGAYEPEQRVNIESLKKRYDMGGTPVREALNRLVVVGLVEALPLKGFQVNSVGQEIALDLFVNKGRLEPLLLEQSLASADDMWESLCLAALHRLRRSQEGEDFGSGLSVKKWVQTANQFLCQLLCPTQSGWLVATYQNLSLHIMQYEYRALLQLPDIKQTVQVQLDAYEDLLQCCLNRRHDDSQRALSACVQLSQGWVMKSFLTSEEA